MTLRIALIGCGRWGRLILRDLLALGAEVHVTTLTDASSTAALAIGAASAGRSWPDPAAVDAFVVATPTATHAEVLDRLVASGRPIFVEKPMTADVECARRLAAAGAGRIFVMDKWRYHPAIEAMRRHSVEGSLGDVLAIRTSRWQWSSPHRDVGPLWILAPHDLSITLHILGRIPPLVRASPVIPNRPELGVEAILADARTQVRISVGIVSAQHRRRCLVVGSEASLELTDAYDDRLLVRRGPPGDATAVADELAVGDEMPLLAELRAFLAFVAGKGPPPLSSAEDGLRVVERLAEIEAAAAAGNLA